MNATPLATIIHISDLHFGPSIFNKRSVFQKLVSSTPVQGRFPHSFEIARALANQVQRLLDDRKKRGIPVAIVHTGDLTRIGQPEEFAVGATFMRATHLLGDARIGLCGDQLTPGILDIPGNHDVWQRGTPAKLGVFEDHYFKHPFRRELPYSGGKIVFHGIDSNRGSRTAHWKANGEVDSAQLDGVCEDIRKTQSVGNWNVVCLHHPLAGEPDEHSRFPFSKLRLNNREGVAQRLAEAGADIVLAGHVHQHLAFKKRNGIRLHLVAGSGCQFGQQNNFLVIDLLPLQWVWTSHTFDHDRLGFHGTAYSEEAAP